MSVAETAALLDIAKGKLYAARLERTAPFIDQTVYTSWNAMAISAYLHAGRVLNLAAPIEFALKTLDRILAEGWSEANGLAHVICYEDKQPVKEPIAGVLDDYAFTIEACIDAWEATGELRYYQAAAAIGDAMVARFYDSVGGAFFDAELPADGKVLGALSARRKPLQDTPTPAGNPSAAIALLRLEHLSGRKDLREKAEDTLENFAGIVEHFGLYAGTYGLALEQFLLPPTQVIIIGQDSIDSPRTRSDGNRRIRRKQKRHPPQARPDQSGESRRQSSPKPCHLCPESTVIRQLSPSSASNNACQSPIADSQALLEALAG